MILSSTRSANHARVESAGDSAGQQLNRVFERHRFAGTPYVLDALTVTGRSDLAYRMLLQPENPGWIYPITMGATSIWERWDSMLPDGRINPGQMTSFNHYALGAVADWLHRVVAGITPLTPGYAKVLVAPQQAPASRRLAGR
jgi:hypothetical protein